METSALRTQLDLEFRLLRAAVAAAPADRKVPSCPDWTAQDLGYHVAEVYLHKAAAIRDNAMPQPWPPARPEVPAEEALDVAYAELVGELDGHSPDAPTWTWYAPDPTARFWLRRMAHETAVHRVDAELVAGIAPGAVTAMDEELARDDVDELLRVFLEFASVTWPEDFGGLVADGDRRAVGLDAGVGARWTVAVTADGVRIENLVDGEGLAACAATVTAPDAATLALWLWNRLGDDAVKADGDAALLAQFQQLRVLGTQ